MQNIGLPDVESLIGFELVGHYVQVEQLYARLVHKNKLAKAAGYTEGDDYRRPEDIAHECELEQWLEAAAPRLPEWFMPGYIFQIEAHLRDLFVDVTGRGNHEIEQRRMAFDQQEKDQHRAVQEAYEYCRKRLYHLIVPLSERRSIEPKAESWTTPHSQTRS